MRKILASLAALVLGAAVAPLPVPAGAQTVIRACVVNSSGLAIRSRFVYTDWQRTRHTSGWVANTLGGRNCATLQDLGELRLEVEVHAIIGWETLCNQNVAPGRSVTLVVTGTPWNSNCSVEQ